MYIVYCVEDTGVVGNEEHQAMEIPQDDESGEFLSIRKRVRGKTRCVKLYKDYADYGVKHVIEFDNMGNFMGKYKSELSSFLGSLVRKEVGVTVLRWKKVSKKVKDIMWEEITVCSTCLFI